MNKYLDELYNLYQEEILDLNIGYEFNNERIDEMYDLVYLLNYLSDECVSESEKEYIMNF
jgi:hypothetical protein